MNGKRVHTAGKLAGKRRVDHTVAFQPALPAKGFRHDIESEMSLAARPVPGMAFVPVRFILDVKALGRESVAQLFRDQIACVHGKSMIPKNGNRFSDKIMLHAKGLPSTRGRGRTRRSALLPPVKS